MTIPWHMHLIMLVISDITSTQGSPILSYFYSTIKKLCTIHSFAIMDYIYPWRKRLTSFQLVLLFCWSKEWDTQKFKVQNISKYWLFSYFTIIKTSKFPDPKIGWNGAMGFCWAISVEKDNGVLFCKVSAKMTFFPCSFLNINAGLQFSWWKMFTDYKFQPNSWCCCFCTYFVREKGDKLGSLNQLSNLWGLLSLFPFSLVVSV